MVDRWRIGQCAMSNTVCNDLIYLLGRVAEEGQSRRNRLVDNLEVAAACQLLELNKREVRLDAGGVAVHHKADCACRCDNCHLCVAVAMLLAALQCFVPGFLSSCVEYGRAVG